MKMHPERSNRLHSTKSLLPLFTLEAQKVLAHYTIGVFGNYLSTYFAEY